LTSVVNPTKKGERSLLINSTKLQRTASVLVDWYQGAARDLPWRRVRNPYGTWVSEIMLQQTRVAAVIPYWQRWMQSFPSVQALADANADTVLAHWAGLGYYSRARNLHAGAKYVAAELAGNLPTRAADLCRIPGIGPYTAGAIASIAFAERTPLVDGNVARVHGIENGIKEPAVQKVLWQHAADLVAALSPKQHPGALNQSLMELGALICTPSSPKCHNCPLAVEGTGSLCKAHTDGSQDRLPVMPRRKKHSELPLLKINALWVSDGTHGADEQNKILVARRKPEALFGGLWELPGDADLRQVVEWIGARFVSAHPVAHVQQTLTHRRLDIAVFTAEVDQFNRFSQFSKQSLGKNVKSRYAVIDQSPYDKWQTVYVSQLRDMAISAATATLIEKFTGSPWKTTPKPSPSLTKVTTRSSKASENLATTSQTQTLQKPRRARQKVSTSSSTIKRKSKAK
jgi:A/G-specific adenine glycosylase